VLFLLNNTNDLCTVISEDMYKTLRITLKKGNLEIAYALQKIVGNQLS